MSRVVLTPELNKDNENVSEVVLSPNVLCLRGLFTFYCHFFGPVHIIAKSDERRASSCLAAHPHGTVRLPLDGLS